MSRRIPTFNILIERYQKQLELMARGVGVSQKIIPQSRAMLLLSHGLAMKQVAQVTGLSACRVEHFRRRFVCLGLPGLVDAPPLKRTSARRELMAGQQQVKGKAA
jgi:hypothetical protein